MSTSDGSTVDVSTLLDDLAALEAAGQSGAAQIAALTKQVSDLQASADAGATLTSEQLAELHSGIQAVVTELQVPANAGPSDVTGTVGHQQPTQVDAGEVTETGGIASGTDPSNVGGSQVDPGQTPDSGTSPQG